MSKITRKNNRTEISLLVGLMYKNLNDFYFNFDVPLMYALWNMELQGVLIDQDAKKQIAVNIDTSIQGSLVELEEVMGMTLPDKFINSSKQVCNYLYNDLKLLKQYDKKTKALSSGVDALTKLYRKYRLPQLQLILKLRGLKKLRSTYLNIKTDDNGKIHTSYGLTKTGRLSSKKDLFDNGMNLQNIPKDKDRDFKIRSMFIADPGKVLIPADLWQAEAMVTAWDAREEQMKEWLLAGNKVHTLVAQMIFNTNEPTEHQYNLAKTVVHGANFGRGIQSIADKCDITFKEAREVRDDGYFTKFPKIKIRQGKIKEDLKYGRRIITNCFGRKRKFLGRNNSDTVREMICQIPQSTVADYINSGLIEIDARLPKGADVLLQVHDELIVQAYPEQIKEVVSLMKECIEKEIIVGGDVLTIPLDIKVGLNWYDLKEVNCD